jgi:hypothetical protein
LGQRSSCTTSTPSSTTATRAPAPRLPAPQAATASVPAGCCALGCKCHWRDSSGSAPLRSAGPAAAYCSVQLRGPRRRRRRHRPATVASADRIALAPPQPATKKASVIDATATTLTGMWRSVGNGLESEGEAVPAV